MFAVEQPKLESEAGGLQSRSPVVPPSAGLRSVPAEGVHFPPDATVYPAVKYSVFPQPVVGRHPEPVVWSAAPHEAVHRASLKYDA